MDIPHHMTLYVFYKSKYCISSLMLPRTHAFPAKKRTILSLKPNTFLRINYVSTCWPQRQIVKKSVQYMSAYLWNNLAND